MVDETGEEVTAEQTGEHPTVELATAFQTLDEREGTVRRVRRLAYVLIVVTFAAWLAALGWFVTVVNRVDDRSLRLAARTEQIDGRVADLTAKLDAAQSERQQLVAQIEALRMQVAGLGAEPVVGPEGPPGETVVGPPGPVGPTGPPGSTVCVRPNGTPCR